jgi:hypothetical protein
MERPTMEH